MYMYIQTNFNAIIIVATCLLCVCGSLYIQLGKAAAAMESEHEQRTASARRQGRQAVAVAGAPDSSSSVGGLSEEDSGLSGSHSEDGGGATGTAAAAAGTVGTAAAYTQAVRELALCIGSAGWVDLALLLPTVCGDPSGVAAVLRASAPGGYARYDSYASGLLQFAIAQERLQQQLQQQPGGAAQQRGGGGGGGGGGGMDGVERRVMAFLEELTAQSAPPPGGGSATVLAAAATSETVPQQ
jgi:hypothetical protein